MDAGHEKLLETFETFELDLEVEEILGKVKEGVEFEEDTSVTEFGEIFEREGTGESRGSSGNAEQNEATYVPPAIVTLK